MDKINIHRAKEKACRFESEILHAAGTLKKTLGQRRDFYKDMAHFIEEP